MAQWFRSSMYQVLGLSAKAMENTRSAATLLLNDCINAGPGLEDMLLHFKDVYTGKLVHAAICEKGLASYYDMKQKLEAQEDEDAMLEGFKVPKVQNTDYSL